MAGRCGRRAASAAGAANSTSASASSGTYAAGLAPGSAPNGGKVQCAPAISAGMPTISWSVRTRSPGMKPTASAKPARPAPSEAREWTTARGCSVVPEVKMINARALELGAEAISGLCRDASAGARLGRRINVRYGSAVRGTPGSHRPVTMWRASGTTVR